MYVKNLNNILCVELVGGLGNQMFQYAAARSLSLKKQASLYFDLSWFGDYQEATPRNYQLSLFPALGETREFQIASADLISTLKFKSESFFSMAWRRFRGLPQPLSPHCFVEDGEGISAFEIRDLPIYMMGYWQNEIYFDDIRETIYQNFTFPDFYNPLARELAEYIRRTENSVSVHVRRGDYMDNPITNRWHGVCTMEYYEKAFCLIQQKYKSPEFFLFSDDISWCKNKFQSKNKRIIYVEFHGENEGIHDMHLMSICKHHITANSSFSWWGAWLSQKDGLNIAPHRWFSAPDKALINPSPKSWVKL